MKYFGYFLNTFLIKKSCQDDKTASEEKNLIEVLKNRSINMMEKSSSINPWKGVITNTETGDNTAMKPDFKNLQ